MNNQDLRKLQLVELNILKFVDEFCKKHDINYFLYGGTALGAARHQGFIPWDDDIDIAMERNEYEKFRLAWYKEQPEGFYFQDPEKEVDVPINHAKIRMNGTVFLPENDEGKEKHKGVWLDIFPIEKVADNWQARTYVRLWGILNLVYKRGYPATRNGKFMYLLTRIMTAIPKKMQYSIYDAASKRTQKYKDIEENYCWISVCETFARLKKDYGKECFGECTRISFENEEFLINKEYEKVLTIQYGDYMKLPPKEERVCKHNPKEIFLGDNK